MMNDYENIYWKIAEIMESCKQIIGRIDAGLVAVAGPFWVMGILTKEGISFEPKFGGYAYDILLNNGKTLEVKTSSLKVSDVRYYAWIAQSKKDRLLYDFLWCVALSEDLKSEPASYLFTKTQIEKMPSAEECKEIFQFRGKAYRQIAYIPDVQTWSCQGWMKDFETYNLRNIDELRLFLS